MWKLPSYVHRAADKTYYIRFRVHNCTYEVRGFNTAMEAMQHKMWMESQVLNGNEFKQKIIKTSMS